MYSMCFGGIAGVYAYKEVKLSERQIDGPIVGQK